MRRSEHLWAILLAAGDGVRVRPYTTDPRGQPVPKQFCALEGRHSMVRWAVDRAARLVAEDRIVAVVARQHRRWWRDQLSGLPQRNILVQPRNKGTAAGLLLPLLDILHRDRKATVLVLPSDHYVADESSLSRDIDDAIRAVRAAPQRVVLVGMPPGDADTEYGWIVPADPPRTPVQRVAAFVEKPDLSTARSIMRQGALLNSLILVALGRTLLHLYDLVAPDLVGGFVSSPGWETGGESGLDDLYSQLPAYDFSRQLLERSVDSLSVLRAAPCGWSDLGTPERLRRFRAETGPKGVLASA